MIIRHVAAALLLAGSVLAGSAQAQDFPLYINDFKYSLEHTAFLIAPPEKGDGIRYTQYSLLYQAAVSGDSILSLMYHQLD